MKEGRSILNLAAEIDRQAKLKRDFVATTDSLRMVDGQKLFIDTAKDDLEIYDITPHAHNQIAERLGIPVKYYDRIQAKYPQLLDQTCNTLFTNEPERRMIRTLDGKARAFLSDRYRRLDNFDLMVAILPELKDRQLEVASCEITETRLYLKFVSPRVQGEVRKGDVVQAGGVITNSEVGMGSIGVDPFVNRLVCLNGMILPEFGMKKYHTGRRIETTDAAQEIYSDETLVADDHAFFMKIRDTVRAVVEQSQFEKILDRMRLTATLELTGKPEKVVEVLSNRYAMNIEETTGVLRHLVDDRNGFTLWGLANAVTSVAGEVNDYTRATDLERTGGQLLNLSQTEWKEIGAAA